MTLYIPYQKSYTKLSVRIDGGVMNPLNEGIFKGPCQLQILLLFSKSGHNATTFCINSTFHDRINLVQ